MRYQHLPWEAWKKRDVRTVLYSGTIRLSLLISVEMLRPVTA
jgi:hypothetical protein